MTSARQKFTRKYLTDLEPGPKRQTYRDEEIRGLILEVSPTGVKTFRIYRKVAGRPEKITLGRFNPQLPDSREFPQGFDLLKALLSQPELNVKMARRLAEAVNVQLDSGKNPADAKRTARGELTLGEMFAKYITDYCIPQKVRTIKGMRETYERYIGALPDLPVKKHGVKRTKPLFSVNWEHRKLSSIRTEEIRKLHTAIGKERSAGTANRVLTLLCTLFNKAISWDELQGKSPTDGVDFFPETSRDRFIAKGEMPAFWQALEEDPSEDFRDYVMLSILAGARAANNASMRWEDIDMDAAEWKVPDTSSKNKEVMRLVLVPEAMAILERRKLNRGDSPWVFPADSASGHMVSFKRRWQNLLVRAGLKDLRLHDLRRSLGSWQARTGASLVIIGKSLGHKSTQATQIYARLDTDPVRESVTRATSAMLAAGREQPASVSPLTQGKRKVA